jgi:hypothetical protein
MDELQCVRKREVRKVTSCILGQPESPSVDRSPKRTYAWGSAVTNICSHARETSLQSEGSTWREPAIRPRQGMKARPEVLSYPIDASG